MRKAISMLMIFAFGASLWADQNVQKAKSENPRPLDIFRKNKQRY